MPTQIYPFIDVAVLDPVRPHFLAGDAVVILSVDLDTVVWANGAGAALLGHDDIEEARGGASNLGLAARRQIAGMPGFPAIGSKRSLIVRVTQRLSSHAVGFLASEVTLPDGALAIMLVAPDLEAGRRSPEETGARAIHGIGEAGHHAALIDGSGAAIAASPGFMTTGPSREVLAGLASDVRNEADRLIKRLVPIGDMVYPVGIAHLSDDPERNLVIVVDDPQPAETGEVSVEEAAPTVPTPPALPPSPPAKAAAVPAAESDTWYFDDTPAVAPALAPTPLAEPLSEDGAGPEPTANPVDEEDADTADDEAALPDLDGPLTLAAVSDIAARFIVDEDFDDTIEDKPSVEISDEAEAPEAIEDDTGTGTSEPDDEPQAEFAEAAEDFGDTDEDVLSAEQPAAAIPPEAAELNESEPVDASADLSEEQSPETSAAEDAPVVSDAASPDDDTDADDAVFRPDLRSGPIRFVWRTDAQGRFSTVSDEFARSVGASAADVVGKSFREVADAFGLDPDGEINGLLDRRDTWSGRSVMWPIEGTDLRVPVDLAALPVYARDRSFEGFRGFGVVRVGDAVVDEEATGFSLRKSDEAPSSETAAEPTEANDPFAGETPAISVDATPERRQADKIIRLAEHRPAANERGLTPTEKNAFREIGVRLKKAGAEASPEAEASEPSQPPADEGRETESEDERPAEVEPRLYSDDLPGPDEADAWQDETPDETDGDGLIEDHLDPHAPEPDEIATASIEDEPSEQETVDEDSDEAVPPTEPAAEADEYSLAAAEYAAEYEDIAPPAEVLPRSVDTSLLDRLPVPVLIHAGDVLHFANQEFHDLTGYASLAELDMAGGLDALFVDGEDSPDRDPEDHRRRLRTKGGEEFPVDALLQSVPWKGGKALLLALRTSPAPSAPVATFEELEDLESRVNEMSTILDTATDGIVIIGNDGSIRSISRPAEALFGFDSTEVAGKPFVSLFAVESQRAARDYLTGLSDNGVASVLNDGREVIGREAQGGFIPLFMTIGRLPGANGYCAVLRDITQWKRAEEELTQARAEAERASSQKTEFLARISHEIRTPLNAIIGFSELMIDEKFGPIVNDRYRDYLRDINKSGNHVLDLVNDLLDISKIEAGEQEMSYEAVSLNETLAEAVAMMQPQANRDRVIIRSSFVSRLPDVVADLRSIRQIALNLLSNAVRYTQAGGQVIVSTSYEPTGDVVLRVRDTGVGMSQGEIEQALKPFKQINALKRPRGEGTGLGLPLTKAMVEANRARFSISSVPGEGTMVEIVFPSQRVLAG
ncbi:PAS domain S-box protein [Mesorhizobium australicum]|uniref:histidine kinase n=1 Tax=Mesorhizobium australicum TaxID=536018 RepID=A0A1X7NQ82_9HYPH|nr:PAS domain S-box protein [Mesorhizobium australicum]SMH39637.1 PAS/PAC sensor signal transduction histidine kinase [Mesorhizobium australicum]